MRICHGLVFSREDATIVRQNLLGHALTLQRQVQRVTDRLDGGACDELRTHTEPRVVVDPGHAVQRGAIAEIDPASKCCFPS